MGCVPLCGLLGVFRHCLVTADSFDPVVACEVVWCSVLSVACMLASCNLASDVSSGVESYPKRENS